MEDQPVDLATQAVKDHRLHAVLDSFTCSLHGQNYTIIQHESLMAKIEEIVILSMDYIRISLQNPTLSDSKDTLRFAKKTGQFMLDFGLKGYIFKACQELKTRPEVLGGFSENQWLMFRLELISFCAIAACIFTVLSYNIDPEDFWQSWLKANEGILIPK